MDHGITTRRVVAELDEARRGSVDVLRLLPVPVPREAPSCVARPSATDVAPPRYPHVRGGSVTHRTARSARATEA